MSLVYYAIGDIHGEADRLIELHQIIKDWHAALYPNRQSKLVHLGDYIDRGPKSYNVIQTLIDLEKKNPEISICLQGNHEELMLNAYNKTGQDAYRNWQNNGGEQTLESYRRNGFDDVPAFHLKWLGSLESYYWDRVAKLIFVHAGIDPVHFPNDGKDRHLWTRSAKFFDTARWNNSLPSGTKVIHGHTPTQSGQPDIDGDYQRINVDTGACYGGDLTAVVLAQGENPRFLKV